MNSSNLDLLKSSLALAVELQYQSWVNQPYEFERAMRRESLDKLAETICAQGDVIMFQEKGRTAGAFAALSRSICLLACASPMGVHIFGMDFNYPTPRS